LRERLEGSVPDLGIGGGGYEGIGGRVGRDEIDRKGFRVKRCAGCGRTRLPVVDNGGESPEKIAGGGGET